MQGKWQHLDQDAVAAKGYQAPSKSPKSYVTKRSGAAAHLREEGGDY